MPKLLFRSAMLGIVVLVGACGFQTPEQRAAAFAAFRVGEARLNCVTAQCQLAWNLARPTAQEAAQSGNLQALAEYVLAADYDQDLGWYYLAMAASGLGYTEAARTYLGFSLQRSSAGGVQSCIPLNCDGIDLPNDARLAMASLPRTGVAAISPRRRVPPKRRAAAAAPGGTWVDPTGQGSVQPASGSAGWIAPVTSTPQ